MSTIFFICPKTNHRADSGIETDDRSRSMLSNNAVRIVCSQCGETHEFIMMQGLESDDIHVMPDGGMAAGIPHY